MTLLRYLCRPALATKLAAKLSMESPEEVAQEMISAARELRACEVTDPSLGCEDGQTCADDERCNMLLWECDEANGVYRSACAPPPPCSELMRGMSWSPSGSLATSCPADAALASCLLHSQGYGAQMYRYMQRGAQRGHLLGLCCSCAVIGWVGSSCVTSCTGDGGWGALQVP